MEHNPECTCSECQIPNEYEGYFGTYATTKSPLNFGNGDLRVMRENAKRYNEGKPKLSHIPTWTLFGEAEVWEHGAKKYGAHNWRKGQPWLQCYDSLMRHLGEWLAGNDLDSESGRPHLDHAACNLRMLLTYRDTHPELDDRFKETKNER